MLLDHAPPVGVELSVVVLPVQTEVVPLMPDGIAFTVTSRFTWQPVGSV
jgi:hypothetical protein